MSELQQAAVEAVRRLREAGHEAFWAGGCVRDLLRGVPPKDYDIATSARPDEVRRLFPGSQSVGAHFGVILARWRGQPLEIATFRADGVYLDGRRPESVTFSSAEEDAKRRDFTINGMFHDPLEGRTLDYVGGQEDLRNGVIRAIGDPAQRFGEDYLRLLRAIRFATVTGFSIEPTTWEALCRQARSILRISPERIRDELDRVWVHPRRLLAFDLLVESGLMEAILPEILALKGVTQPPRWHPEGDVFVHTRLMLSLLPEQCSLPLVLSVLFHDIAKPATWTYDEAEDRIRFNGHDQLGAEMTGDILRRLKYSNDVIDDTVVAVEHHMVFKDVKRMRNAKLKRMMSRPTYPDELALHRVDCLGSNGLLDNYDYMLAKGEEFAAAPLIPPRLLTGRDLMERGLPPGPELGGLLREIQDLHLDGQLGSREAALAWLDERLASAR